MQTFKEKLRDYYPADAQSKVTHHFMNNDPSRHGMHEEDMTHPREGVVPNRRFKTGGHVTEDDHCSPPAKIGQKVNEAYLRTSHKKGGKVCHKDMGGFMQGAGNVAGKAVNAVRNVAGQATDAVRNAPSSFAQGFQNAKSGGSIKAQKGLPYLPEHPASGPLAGHKKEGGRCRDMGGQTHTVAQEHQPMMAKRGRHMTETIKHVHTHKHYDAGGNVNPDKGVPSDIGLSTSPKTSREQYDSQRGTKPIYRAMGGAGKIRKGVMNALGQQLISS